MTRYLVATASTEVTAAACDYLEPRLTGDDEVYVLTVDEAANPITERTALLRLAQERLADTVEVRTIRRTGDPTREIVQFAREKSVDEIIIGPRRAAGPKIGSSMRAVLNRVEVPVFVVPLSP
ncbi:universal stress protein [Natronomonas sp. EA1]|uniref:universal stress protein n=1 Tax=Natronomonas sp. EA1 TaxID=3421655 RepID=UPI003EB89AFB